MSAAPPLTIAIPFFDEERNLASAVRSILAQTMGEFELLLVDDGSTDRSLEVARAFRDPRIVVLSDGVRRGLPARLNEIATRARSELVARMDADDVSHPTRIAQQLERMEATGAEAVGTWAGLVDDTLVPFGVIESGTLPPTVASALETGILAHATLLARRSWLLENPFDESLLRAQDLDLWCRTAERSSFAVVPEPLYVIRLRPRSVGFAAEYAYAQKLNRRILLRYGPHAFGVVPTARAWARSLAKTAVVRAAARTGQADRLVRRRGRPPTARESAMVEEALRSAVVTHDEIEKLV